MKTASRKSDLVVSVLRDVSYPRQCLVATLLDYLEISDLDATDREVRNLELNLDGNP
jgi:hypothetical protein